MTVRVGGGFGGGYPDMSPSLRARIATADAEYEQQAVHDELLGRRRWPFGLVAGIGFLDFPRIDQ